MKISYRSPILVVSASSFMMLVGCAPSSTQDGVAQYLDDSAVTGKVKAALFKNKDISSSDISVETIHGEVMLGGTVTSQEVMDAALAATTPVKGVTAVRNEMKIK